MALSYKTRRKLAFLILLVGPQFGRRRAGQDASRDHLALTTVGLRVFPGAESIDQRFRHVLDHCEAARHVAVQRAVAGGHLALVAGGQHDRAELVRQRHQQGAADARLDVFFGGVFGPPGELGGQALLERIEHRRDRDLVVAHAQALGHVARVDPGDVGGVRRRHHHRAHLVGAQRIDRNGQHQRRVNAARQTQQRAGKAVFAQIVAHAQH